MAKNLDSKSAVSKASSTDKTGTPFSAAAAAAAVVSSEAREKVTQSPSGLFTDDELDAIKPIRGADLVRTKTPPLSFVWNGLVEGSVGCIVAAGSTGKSYFALEAALEVAVPELGPKFLDLGVQKEGKVAIFNAEDPTEVVRFRMHCGSELIPAKLDKKLDENIELYPLRGRQPNITDSKWLDRVCRWSEGKRLVFFDTLTRWHRADENSNDAMAEVLSYFELVSERTGAAVLFLHHVNKSSARDGSVEEQQSSRGAAAITDNIRWQGWLQVMSKQEAGSKNVPPDLRKQFVQYGGAKENYGAATNARWYRRGKGGLLLPADFSEFKKNGGVTYDE